MPFNDPPAPRMKDAIGLIRAAFAAQKGGGTVYDGPYYHVKIPQYSRPGAARLDIPIAIAAVNRGMIATAAADGKRPRRSSDLYAQVHRRGGAAAGGR